MARDYDARRLKQGDFSLKREEVAQGAKPEKPREGLGLTSGGDDTRTVDALRGFRRACRAARRARPTTPPRTRGQGPV